MKFIVLFEDNPKSDPMIRAIHMQDHLDFLERHRASVEAAGPLKNESDEGCGGLWVVDAQSTAEVQNLVESDPFWPTGLRKSVSIYAWQQVFAIGVRQI
mgnify:CR=1 FL=1